MKKRRGLYWASILLCSAGLLLSGGMFLRQWAEYRAGETAYRALTEAVVTLPEAPAGGEAAPAEPEDSALEVPEMSLPQVDFAALADINPDVIGWLYGLDTVLSYPVVQGEDNDYYLTHLFDGTENRAGCLFLDSRCQGLAGQNSVIYGHYMKNGTQFTSLANYKDQAYYDAHPTLFLLTPEGTCAVELFSAYVTATDGDAWQLTFSSEEEYGTWLEEIQRRSCFDCPVVPSTSDQIITLSTCDYTFSNARFVCHGLVRPCGEDLPSV